MAGLGLTNALQGYMQGKAWRDNENQAQLERERQAKVQAANKAAIDYIGQAKQQHEAAQVTAAEEWTKSGKAEPFQATPFKTNDAVMFRAAATRGDALLGAGLFDEYAKNRAAIIPMQMQARQQAWQRYQTDKDPGALGQALYDTIPDGKHVVKYDMLNGTGPDGKKAGGQVRFHLDDGSVHLFKPEEVEAMAKNAMTDPAKFAEHEWQRDLLGAKAKMAAALQQQKASDEERLEGKKAASARGLAEFTQGAMSERSAASDKSREKAAGIHAGATTKAAEIRAKGGSGPDGKGKVHSVFTDARGRMGIVRQDGTNEFLKGEDGKPLVGSDRGKQITSIMKAIKADYYDKSPAELRALATQALDADSDEGDDDDGATGLDLSSFLLK